MHDSLHPVSLTLPFLVGLTCASLPAQQRELSLRGILTRPGNYVPARPYATWVPGQPPVVSFVEKGKPRTRNSAGSPDRVVLVDPKRGRLPIFDGKKLQQALAKGGFPRLNGRVVPPIFTWLDAKTVRLQLGNRVFHWDTGKDAAQMVWTLPSGTGATAFTKKDERVAFIRGHQLHVHSQKDAPRTITTDGSEDIIYGGAAHRAEFGIHDGLWWCPHGRFLAFYREDLSPITKYPYVDHTVFPPRAIHGRYPYAGKDHSRVRVGVHDTKTGKLVFLERGPVADVYWTNVTFHPDGTKIYVALVNRAQSHMQLVRFDSVTGKREKVLFKEKDEQWIEPEHGPIFVPNSKAAQPPLIVTPTGGATSRAKQGFLWFSPRDGFRHLYHYGNDGALIRQVTKGKFDVRRFLGFDTGGKHALVQASGENPLDMHVWRVAIATGEMQQVTSLPGQHTGTIAPDGSHFLDWHTSIDNPGVLNIRGAGGSKQELFKAKSPVTKLGKQSFFTIKADDGTPLHGHLILPPGTEEVNPTRIHPALLYVYGGPHSQLVRNQWLGGANLWLHWMATQGFVICRLDNRGTDNRGIEFSQSIHRQMSVLEVKDQLAAVNHLKSKPYVDGRRIGVHGWSYGGYMTLSLMLRAPRVFKCGASGAPVTDWRFYETGYTERYMDTPAENPKGYKNCSVLPLAKRLKDRLLVIHGTDDKTVMWSHSLAFVDKCVDSGVLVDYMPYPMQKHGVRGRDRVHLYRLLTRFFREHLAGEGLAK